MAKFLGRAIEESREGLKLTRAALARAAQVDPGELARIESGERPNPSFATVCRIAAALGVSADDLGVRAGLLKGKASTRSQRSASPASALAGLDSLESLLRRASHQIETLRKRLKRDS